MRRRGRDEGGISRGSSRGLRRAPGPAAAGPLVPLGAKGPGESGPWDPERPEAAGRGRPPLGAVASGRGTGWGPAAFLQGEPRGQGSCPLLPPIPAFSWGPRWPNPSGGRRAGGPGGRSPQHPLPGRKAGGERWAWDLGGSGARPARSLSLSELGAASATCRFVTNPPTPRG